jgi:ABC-type bacteriocin/lantibiotic exporter with double-glycine peptidase domain
VCLIVAAAVGLAFPQVVRHLLDAAFERHDRRLLDRVALGLVALFALQGLMNFVQVFLLTSTTERVIAALRVDVFAHLIRLSPGFYTERRTGELTSRLSSGSRRVAIVAEYMGLGDVAAGAVPRRRHHLA